MFAKGHSLLEKISSSKGGGMLFDTMGEFSSPPKRQKAEEQAEEPVEEVTNAFYRFGEASHTYDFLSLR